MENGKKWEQGKKNQEFWRADIEEQLHLKQNGWGRSNWGDKLSKNMKEMRGLAMWQSGERTRKREQTVQGPGSGCA